MHLGLAPGWALLFGLLPALWLSTKAPAGWRRVLVLLGLPALLLGQGGLHAVPAWAWLAGALLLLALYPLQAWRDAPLYPTAPDALVALAASVPLGPHARVLDAGSGLGHGLAALRRAYPTAALQGVERSILLAWASRGWALSRRVRNAPDPGWQVSIGDFWALSWAGFDLVYLFQRPETMPRAWAKACAQMRPGAWLVSLEFPIPDRKPEVRLTTPGGRGLYAYRIPEPGISVDTLGGR